MAQDHPHAHAHDHDEHDHDQVPMDAEAPLDPANQSLADALRASFRVLKLVMWVVVILFVVSGVFIVDQKEVVIRLMLGGKEDPEVKKPGIHWAWPYPINDKVRVSVAPKTATVDAFWLNIREEDRLKELSELNQRSGGLDPAVDGALLTGDKAIMHLLLRVQYQINPAAAGDYVRNVSDEAGLLQMVLRNAAVAEAARTTADVLWRDPAPLVAATQKRGQAELERLNTGIILENVAADKSYFPLQTKEQFLSVDVAQNRKRELINEALTERQKKLNGVAGAAWQQINEEVIKLDQTQDETERQEIIGRIGTLLRENAFGEAGGKIKLAERDREKIINETKAAVSQFRALFDEYQRTPELIRLRLGQRMLNDLYTSTGVVKWVLPPGVKQVVLWLNKDPKETAEAERRRLEERTKGRK